MNEMNEDQRNENQIKAETILQQLGGRRFTVMTGARNLCNDNGALLFLLPSKPHYTRNGINCVKIALDDLDLYTVEFKRIYGRKTSVIARHDGIYADQLRAVFTEATGLETSLGTMRS